MEKRKDVSTNQPTRLSKPLLLSSLQETVSRNIAQVNLKLAQKNQLVSGLFKIVNTNATTTKLAGATALPRRATQQPALSGNVLLTTIASTLLKKPLLLLLTPKHALKQNAPINGLHAKRTPSVSLLSKNARANVEPNKPAGNSALPVRKTQLQLMLPNALLLMAAFPKPELSSQLHLLKSALKSTARPRNKLVRMIEDVS